MLPAIMLPLRNLLAYAENEGPEFALAPPAEDDAIVWAGVRLGEFARSGRYHADV
jgi:hypothetical protein